MKAMTALLTLLGILIGGPTDGQSILNETRTVEISYEVNDLPGLNSDRAEFSPSVYGDQLVFTSDREYNLVNYGESRWKRHSRLNIFAVDVTTYTTDSMDFSKPQLFEDKFMSISHSGPITFSKDGKLAVFTQVAYKKEKTDGKVSIHKPALYYSKKEGDKWGETGSITICETGKRLWTPIILTGWKNHVLLIRYAWWSRWQ